MTYQETLDYLYNQLPYYQRIGKAAYKANLVTTQKLDEYFGHPHRQFSSVHIAGTNGKGSVSHMLASVLQEAGYQTGLHTSPHLKDFRERIRINGIKVPESFVIDFVEKHKAIFEELTPSFFELSVMMALKYFAEQNIDIAIIEVGLGGRLDSTNILSPLASVITNISLDHTEFLGDTLPAIAREKAGIIKEQTPVVIGQYLAETYPVFNEISMVKQAPLYLASGAFSTTQKLSHKPEGQVFDIFRHQELLYKDLTLGLEGHYQASNLITCLRTLEVLEEKGYPIHEEAIRKGLAKIKTNTGLMGRWQILGTSPLIVCDTGHNPEGIQMLVDQIRKTPHQNLHMVMGFVKEKKLEEILQILPDEAVYYFSKASLPRSLDEKELQDKASKAGLEGSCYENISEALKAAKKQAAPEDMIFIGGSTFVVAEIL